MQKVNTAKAIIVGHLWKATLRHRRQLEFEGEVTVLGRPIVRVDSQASIHLGRQVTLNSAAFTYHAGMFGPVTLIADTPASRITVGEGTRINGAVIHAQRQISIGRGVLIAAQATIMDSNGHILVPPETRTYTRDEPRAVTIGDNVWIGLGAVVLPGTTIGEGSVIGANAVASGEIPARSVVRNETKVSRLPTSPRAPTHAAVAFGSPSHSDERD